MEGSGSFMPRNRKLSDEQVRRLRERWRPRPTVQELADEHGTSHATMWAVLHKFTYKNVEATDGQS